jgi:putative tricarboxylic transport membrane protein
MIGSDMRWRDLAGKSDALSGLTLLFVAVAAWVAARWLPFGTLNQPGAGFLPKALAVVLSGLALVLWVRGAIVSNPDAGSLWPDRAGALRVGVMCAALFVYVLAVDTAGYLLTTVGLFCILLRWVGRQSWPATLVTALLASVVSYLVFARWLMVSLPTGTWVP